jgi:hypothetical protein
VTLVDANENASVMVMPQTINSAVDGTAIAYCNPAALNQMTLGFAADRK